MTTLQTPPDTRTTPHPAFDPFPRWSGADEPAMLLDWLGVRTRRSFFSLFDQLAPAPRPGVLRPAYPPIDEEFFEWVDVLQAVHAAHQSRQPHFTMIELGAGWGRWLLRAHAALRSLKSQTVAHLVAVEAEPEHFAFLLDHLQDNGVDPTNHRLHQAAVDTTPGVAPFFVGAGDRWYGQALAGPHVGPVEAFPEAAVQDVSAVTLAELLEPHDRVDLIDLDVQGAEADVLASAQTLVDQRVARVHIGTHGESIEADCRSLFQSLGWTRLNDYPCGGKQIPTPHGPVDFGDGVQSWTNPKLAQQGGGA